MKGISAVIATILMLMITIAITGTAYLYVTGVFTSKTNVFLTFHSAQCSPSGILVYIRNDGSGVASNVNVSRDDGADSCVISSITAGNVNYCTIPSTGSIGNHQLQAASASQTISANVYCVSSGVGGGTTTTSGGTTSTTTTTPGGGAWFFLTEPTRIQWNISNPSDFNWEFKPVDTTVLFNTTVYSNAIRVTACKPEGSIACSTETEIPYQIISNTTTLARIIIETNVSANSWDLFNIYYGDNAMSQPSYPSIVWNSTSYPDQYANSNWQTFGGFIGAAWYPTLASNWMINGGSDIFGPYKYFEAEDYAASCTFYNDTGGPIFAQAHQICSGAHAVNETAIVYKNFKPVYTEFNDGGTISSQFYLTFSGIGDSLYCYDSSHKLTTLVGSGNAQWIFDNCREGWVQVLDSSTNATFIFDETKITSSSSWDYLDNYAGQTLIYGNYNPASLNPKVFWLYANNGDYVDARNMAMTVKSSIISSLSPPASKP